MISTIEAHSGTASGKREIASTRPTADAPVPPWRCESVTPCDYPRASTLRHCAPWTYPSGALLGPSLERVAHHEAGHVVLLEWLGVDGVVATATPTSGRCSFPLKVDQLQEPGPDESGELCATAASSFHAGMAAELLFLGIPWAGPMFYPSQADYLHADDLLAPKFGRHASGAHAFAQRVALHVLSHRWERVREVANRLVLDGRWAPANSAKTHAQRCPQACRPVQGVGLAVHQQDHG